MTRQESRALTQQMLQMCKEGKSFEEIAKACNCTKQCVNQRFWKQLSIEDIPTRLYNLDSKIIYPNLAKWMYANQISKAWLANVLGITSNNYKQLNKRLHGQVKFSIAEVRKLLNITGFTFEYLFELKDGCKEV